MNMPRFSRDRSHRLLRGIWSLLPSRPANRILYYHSVGDQPLSTAPASLDAELAWMRCQGLTFVTLSQVPGLIASGSQDPWVCLTFDDGYKDNRTVAAPILAKHDAVATFFVVASYCRERSMPTEEGYMLYPGREMLDHDDVAALAGAGHEIASHGWTHDLATEVRRRPDRSLLDELLASRETLERIAGVPVSSFAYPNGQNTTFDVDTRRDVERAGFTAAATTRWGAVTLTTDPLQLPRCRVDNTPAQSIIGLLNGHQDYLTVAQRLKKSSGWPDVPITA